MLQTDYMGYRIKAAPVKTPDGRWTVSVVIEKQLEDRVKSRSFFADDNIRYILEIEAEKECINLGKNLIKSNLTGF